MGLTLNRSFVVLMAISCATAFLWRFAADLFLHFNVNSGTCEHMNEFLRIRTFSIPAEIFVLSYEKYLMSLGLMKPSMYSAAIYTCLLIVGECISTYQFGTSIGVKGLACVLVLCNYLDVIAMVMLSFNHPSVQRTLHIPTAETFSGLRDFFRFGLPGCIMSCAEW